MNPTGMMEVPSRTERLFVGALRVFTVLSVVCVLCYLVTMLRARHELSQPESAIGAQAMMLAEHGTLYYGLKDYPYTVCAYMPIFYSLEAMFTRLGMPTIAAGRMISFAAMLTSFYLCWRFVLLYTGNRYAAWIAAVLASSSTLILNWGTTGQTDMLAVTFALAGFYQFSRFYVRGENALLWAGLLATAAFFTKQTALAAPAAMLMLLLFKNRKTALLFGAALGGFVAALALGFNALTDGRFFGNTVFGNMNHLDLEKLMQHLHYFGLVSGALLATLALSVSRMVRSKSVALVVYFLLATSLFLVFGAKVGSDSNYQLEATLILIAASCVGLVELNFFELVFRNSKSWITLLQGLVVLFLVMNYRIMVPDIIVRFVRENLFRQEMLAVEPYIRRASGHVISTDLDPMAILRHRIDLEPLIYTLLVTAGRIDPEPVRKDLSQAAIPLVILYEDLSQPIPDNNLEIPRLPPVDLAEIRQHYRMVQHIPGPYLGGIFVYLPKVPDAQDLP